MLVSELIDRTYSQWLWPGGVSRPSFDILATGINTTETSIVTEGRITVPRDSVVEIESELILIESATASTLEANERGYLDTAPASHSAGVRILLDPKFSRKAIFDVLCTTIGDLYPALYRRVVDSSLEYTDREPMDLPTGTLELLRATVELSNGELQSLKQGVHYRVLPEFSPPKIRFSFGGMLGNTLTLVVAKDFTLPTDETKDLTSICGVPASLAPHLAAAVAGTLLQAQELPRTAVDQIRRLLAQQGVQVGAALNVGQALKTMFEQRVAAERRRLRVLDPPELVIER